MSTDIFNELVFERLCKDLSFLTKSDIINIYLVLCGGRDAFLFEAHNMHYTDKEEEVLHRVKRYFEDSFGNFCALREGKNLRLLIVPNELKKKAERIIKEKDDSSLGEILGFFCPGLPDKDHTRYSYTWFVKVKNNKSETIFAELCDRKLGNEINAKKSRILETMQKVYGNNVQIVVKEKVIATFHDHKKSLFAFFRGDIKDLSEEAIDAIASELWNNDYAILAEQFHDIIKEKKENFYPLVTFVLACSEVNILRGIHLNMNEINQFKRNMSESEGLFNEYISEWM